MEKIKQFKGIIAIIIALLGFAFYWFQYRPAQARKECVMTAQNHSRELLKTKANMNNGTQLQDAANKNLYLQPDYEISFKNCLSEHGIAN